MAPTQGSLAVWTGRVYRKESEANITISIVKRVYTGDKGNIQTGFEECVNRASSTLPSASMGMLEKGL